MPDKYCRICWNTEGWRKPSGDAAQVERGRSHVARHKFGFEEWLLNYEWMINGQRYGFLQPIHKYYTKYSGTTFRVHLYTFTPEGRCLLVGMISNIFVPESNELTEVYNTFSNNGWLDEMKHTIELVGGNGGIIDTLSSQSVINVRFNPEDVEIFDPRPEALIGHKISNAPRFYHPYDWNENDLPQIGTPQLNLEENDPDFDEAMRTRAAQKATKFDPKHVKIQNRLFRYLRNQFGVNNVLREEQYVDLTVLHPHGATFYEIKSDETVKKCIRSALGQLLEYAHYPEDNRANRLVVVGDPAPTDDDEAYISFLRNSFNLEIFYAQFFWETESLCDEI